jgi:hypothetical protein
MAAPVEELGGFNEGGTDGMIMGFVGYNNCKDAGGCSC